MNKIKNTIDRAGAGLSKVGAKTRNGARNVAYTGGTAAGAALLLGGFALGSTGAWLDGQRAVDRAETRHQHAAAQMAESAAADKTAAVEQATRLAERAAAGKLEIDQLPQGVDRAAAAKAERDGKAFAFRGYIDGGTTGDIPCVAVLRMPSGTQVTFSMQPDATGFAEPFGPTRTGIGCGRLDGIPLPARPPVTERAQLWDAAIRKGQAYVYDVPGNGQDGDAAPTFTRPTFDAFGAIRLDVTRCTGFHVPSNLTRAGQPLEATAPMIAETWSVYCWGSAPSAVYP